jgi:periplasmic protein TonB
MHLATKLSGMLVLSLAFTFPASSETPKKLTRTEAINATTSKVQPEYPPIAKQLRLEGTVELEAVVSESGTVEDVTVVSGNPVLTKPAATALKKWKFSPFTDAGKPVKALAPVTMSFKL